MSIQTRRNQREVVEQELMRVTRLLAAEDSRVLEGTRDLLPMLSEIPSVRTATPGACNSLLNKAVQANSEVVEIAVASPSGHVLCASSRPANADVSQRTFFKNVLQTGAASVGVFAWDETSGKSVIYLGYPIRNAAGQIENVLYATVDLRWLDGFREKLSLPPGSVITAFDQHGTVLARYPDPERWIGTRIDGTDYVDESLEQGHPGLVDSIDPDGVRRLRAFAPAGPADTVGGVHLSVGVPWAWVQENASAPLMSSLLLLWAAGAMALTASAWTVNRGLLSPLLQLRHAASRLAEGDLGARSGLPHRRDELGELAYAFDSMATSMETALRVRDELLTLTAHELKTPLTSLNLQLQAVRRRVRDGERVEAEELASKLEFAQRQVWRIDQLMSVLADVDTFAAGELRVDRSEMDLAALVRRVAMQLEHRLAQSGSELDCHLPDHLFGAWDEALLERAVSQLLSNAVKFGQGRPITLRLEDVAGIAQLTVIDRGVGIPYEEQERIFEPFERAVSVRHYGGLGVGLWVVKRVVDALGGQVRVRSQPGRGAAFIVTLPRPHLPMEQPAPGP